MKKIIEVIVWPIKDLKLVRDLVLSVSSPDSAKCKRCLTMILIVAGN